jgi:hypothetical protein
MSRLIIKTRSPFDFGKREGGEVFVNTDELTPTQRTVLRHWINQYPETVTDDLTPVPQPVEERTPPRRVESKPDVIERKAPAVEFVDPIAQLRNEDLRQQIEQQQVDARLTEYQIVQGLVDDQHNAALLRDWIQKYGTGYAALQNVDRAIRALRPQLHWQQLSEFTKRLAGM